MGVSPRFGALLLLVAGAAPAKPVMERVAEAQIDRSAQTIVVHGAGAPDLHAPSAQVGRVKAERLARTQAGKQLQRVLQALGAERLGCADPDHLPSVEPALAAAKPASIEWGADGSVQLDLLVRVADLVDRPPPALKPGEAVIARGEKRPPLVASDDGKCAGAHLAPPVFESEAELRAARPDLAPLEVVAAKAAAGKVVAAWLSDGGGR